ncbi:MULTISPECIES: DUF3313 domain-containing protein [Xanthobacteraceae]|uniref:DUF3313 domain-containing protein n=1 Tax=Xanthobacteraceae TaxID=335928 RepID=UPI002ACA29DF|nr:DUF3313 domain-containing protein [Labrys sp. ZIDIC5]MDZ5451461.1 DUF3313 domain-containing protein [Labrys sp. ZIDIC5]HML29724.1 DUF3313 domain-containing protein [Hyphomicrobium sp.]
MKFILRHSLACLLLGSALLGCTTADPLAYSQLTSVSYLQPNPTDPSGRVPYRYAGNANWKFYDKAIIDPVTVYRGPDNQFIDVSEPEKAELAAYMRERFAQTLASRFRLVNTRMPGTVRIHLTLTGAKKTTPVLGPFSHIDIGGGAYNAVQAARGKEGSLTGSVSYAVEIYDAADNRLLSAFVAKQYPGAMNVGASFGAFKASKVAIDKGADDLLVQFR